MTATEVKAKILALLDEVASGDEVEITKHGRVVASGPADEVITTENISDAFEFPIAIERSGGRWQARAARVLS